MNAVSYLTDALNLAPLLIQAGEDMFTFAGKIYAVIKSGDDPSDEDWAELEAKEQELRAVLDAPIDEGSE